MKANHKKCAFRMAGVLILLLLALQAFSGTANAQQPADVPNFQVDPFWPKPLPDRWVTGSVGGTCVDAKDHVFTVNRGDLSAKEKKNATAAPPIVEFDEAIMGATSLQLEAAHRV